MTILDYIKDGKLPELPISFDKTSIIYMAVGLFIIGLILMLIYQMFFRK